MRDLNRGPAKLEHGDEGHEVVQLDVLRFLAAAHALVEDEGEGGDDTNGACEGKGAGEFKLYMKMTRKNSGQIVVKE